MGVILGVIATKMIGETFDIELLTPLQSLGVVVGILGIGVTASLMGKGDEKVEEKTGV